MGAIPSAMLSRKGIARYGGVSRTGLLSSPPPDSCMVACEVPWSWESICQETFQCTSVGISAGSDVTARDALAMEIGQKAARRISLRRFLSSGISL